MKKSLKLLLTAICATLTGITLVSCVKDKPITPPDPSKPVTPSVTPDKKQDGKEPEKQDGKGDNKLKKETEEDKKTDSKETTPKKDIQGDQPVDPKKQDEKNVSNILYDTLKPVVDGISHNYDKGTIEFKNESGDSIQASYTRGHVHDHKLFQIAVDKDKPTQLELPITKKGIITKVTFDMKFANMAKEVASIEFYEESKQEPTFIHEIKEKVESNLEIALPKESQKQYSKILIKINPNEETTKNKAKITFNSITIEGVASKENAQPSPKKQDDKKTPEKDIQGDQPVEPKKDIDKKKENSENQPQNDSHQNDQEGKQDSEKEKVETTSLSQVNQENVGKQISVNALVIAIDENNNNFKVYVSDKDGQNPTFVYLRGDKDPKFAVGAYLSFTADVENYKGTLELTGPTNIKTIEQKIELPKKLTSLTKDQLNDPKNQNRVIDLVDVKVEQGEKNNTHSTNKLLKGKKKNSKKDKKNKKKNNNQNFKKYYAIIGEEKVSIYNLKSDLPETVTFRDIVISKTNNGQIVLKIQSFTKIESSNKIDKEIADQPIDSETRNDQPQTNTKKQSDTESGNGNTEGSTSNSSQPNVTPSKPDSDIQPMPNNGNGQTDPKKQPSQPNLENKEKEEKLENTYSHEYYIKQKFNDLEESVKEDEAFTIEEREVIFEAINNALEKVLSGKVNFDTAYNSIVDLISNIVDNTTIKPEENTPSKPNSDSSTSTPEDASKPKTDPEKKPSDQDTGHEPNNASPQPSLPNGDSSNHDSRNEQPNSDSGNGHETTEEGKREDTEASKPISNVMYDTMTFETSGIASNYDDGEITLKNESDSIETTYKSGHVANREFQIAAYKGVEAQLEIPISKKDPISKVIFELTFKKLSNGTALIEFYQGEKLLHTHEITSENRHLEVEIPKENQKTCTKILIKVSNSTANSTKKGTRIGIKSIKIEKKID